LSDLERHAIKSVVGILEESGYHAFCVHEDPQRIEIPMDMGMGRKQVVYIECSGTTPRGDQMIRMFSGCMELGTGETQSLIQRYWNSEADMYRDLLMRNFREGYGKFTIATFSDKSMLVISCDQLVPTLDPAELDAMIQYVAGRADHFEESLGKDQF